MERKPPNFTEKGSFCFKGGDKFKMGNKSEGHRSFGGVRPMGQLGEILDRYEAPNNVQATIARRAGGIIGSGRVSHAFVEQTIQDSMSANGLPKWDNVTQRVGEAVRDVYRGNRRF